MRSSNGSADCALAVLMEDLRRQVRLSRATLRLKVPGDQPLPMTHEALAPGVTSIKGRVVQASGSPTVQRMMTDHAWVIVSDCERQPGFDPLFDDPGYREMVRDYGGLGAFVAAPLFEEEQLVGILSLHHLGSPRYWTAQDRTTISAALERVRELRPRLVLERRLRQGLRPA